MSQIQVTLFIVFGIITYIGMMILFATKTRDSNLWVFANALWIGVSFLILYIAIIAGIRTTNEDSIRRDECVRKITPVLVENRNDSPNDLRILLDSICN